MGARTAALALAAAALAAGCAGQQPGPVAVVRGGDTDGLHGTEITGVIDRPALALRDTDGGTFDVRSRPADELTAMFFGYTRCPDVCPSAMADLAAARRLLDDQRRQAVKVLFVTEDPRTDTPRVLRGYLDSFDPSFLGLIGGNDQTEQALDALKAPRTEIAAPHLPDSSPHSHPPGSGHAVDHAGSVYVFHGARTVVYTGGTTPSQYAEDFRQLLG